MKTLYLTLFATTLALVPPAQAQRGTLTFPPTPKPKPEPPPRVWVAPDYQPQQPPLVVSQAPYLYDRKPPTGVPFLVPPDQAQEIVNRFKQSYGKLGSPRFAFCVNRQESTGINPSAAQTKGPALDPQTIQDVERLFARPFQAAGAAVADAKAVSDVIGNKPLDEFIASANSPQARKNRDALAKIADAVVEIVISSKNISAPDGQGGSVPDIQATAIRLSDSHVFGQTSATASNRLDVRDISEGTALLLMRALAR